jgi:hypothetical protein
MLLINRPILAFLNRLLKTFFAEHLLHQHHCATALKVRGRDACSTKITIVSLLTHAGLFPSMFLTRSIAAVALSNNEAGAYEGRCESTIPHRASSQASGSSGPRARDRSGAWSGRPCAEGAFGLGGAGRRRPGLQLYKRDENCRAPVPVGVFPLRRLTVSRARLILAEPEDGLFQLSDALCL